VLEILIYLVQPLEERLRPAPQAPPPPLPRPATAMTPQERQRALDQAMEKMSAKVRVVIKNTLDGDGGNSGGGSGGGVGKKLKGRSQTSMLKSKSMSDFVPDKSVGRKSEFRNSEPRNSEPRNSESRNSESSRGLTESLDCVHEEQGLKTRSLSPLIENMTKEEIDAEFEAIEEDVEEEDHPIDLIDLGHEIDAENTTNGEKQNEKNVKKVQIEKSALSTKSRPSSTPIFDRGDYEKFARSRPPSGRQTSSKSSSNNPSKLQTKSDDQNSPWATSLRHRKSISARSPKSQRNTPTPTPPSPPTPEQSPTNSILRQPAPFHKRAKVQLWRPLAEQCRERIVACVGSTMISELCSAAVRESTKVDTLDFLHQYVMHGQVRRTLYCVVYGAGGGGHH
jgi:hypothetical protein